MGRFRFGAERRHLGELRLDDAVHLGFLEIDLAFVAAELQMHGTGRTGGRDAERLADHVGKTRHVVDGGVHLGDRLERRDVVDFLIELAEFRFRIATARHSDHRRMREEGIAQTGGEIERADHLRHADAGLARRPRIAVGHIGCGFFTVTVHARDLGAALHFGKGSPQHRRHHEDVGDAVTRQHLGKNFGADAFRIVSNGTHCLGLSSSFNRV